MKTSELVVETEFASRYLQALCKHFKHKISVEFDEQKGFADFQIGKCYLDADQSTLRIRCETPGDAEDERVRLIIDDHLKRFAFRENLSLDWRAVG